MLNKTKSISIASAALLAGLMLGMTGAEARFDDFGAREAAVLRAPLDVVDLTILQARPRAIDSMVTASIAPLPALEAPIKRATPNYNVFRSVVVPVGKLAAFNQWGRVQPASTLAAPKKFLGLIAEARELSQVDALKLVNREVNRAIRYRSDKGDQWQTLAQSAARGTGDCEDYAIAKMQLLAELGFTPDQLQFIVLKDTRRQLYHAVLAVHVGGKRYILDNLSNTAASDDIFRTYKPIVSFVGGKSFVHGFKGGETAVAMGKGGFGAIRLGGN